MRRGAVCYRIDNVPLQVFAAERLRKLVGELFCYRIDGFTPIVFAGNSSPGSSVKQICYRKHNVPLQVFAAERLRKLAGDLFCYRIDGFTPKIFAREKPLARRSQKSPKNRAISPSYRI